MEWIRILFILLILGRSIYTDIKRNIIENRCIIIGLLLGLLCALADEGLIGIWESIRMVGLVLMALFGLFLIKGLGAGDIKLLCVLAAFYPEYILSIVVASFMVAAGIALGKMVLRFVKRKPVYIHKETLNFSIPIGCGVLFVLIMNGIP